LPLTSTANHEEVSSFLKNVAVTDVLDIQNEQASSPIATSSVNHTECCAFGKKVAVTDVHVLDSQN
jgi:hypothetical protein